MGSRDGLESLKVALSMIQLLLAEARPMTVKEISQRMDLGERTVYRYLSVLDEALYPRLVRVDQHPARYYLD